MIIRKRNSKYLLCDIWKIVDCFKNNHDNSDSAIARKLDLPKTQVTVVTNRFVDAKMKNVNEKARV
jgi:hypothetical protein